MTKYITHIQLRAARHALNLGVRDLAKILKVSKATISKAELDKTRDFFYKHSAALLDFFKNYNIFFPNEYCIRYGLSSDVTQNNCDVLTRFQLRIARHVLNITQYEIAQLICVNKSIVNKIEKLENEKQINIQYDSLVPKFKNMFQQHNIIFPDQLSIFYKKYVDKGLIK